MKYQIVLNNGSMITASFTDYDASNLSSKLNDNKVLFISIGDMVINKHILSYIVPMQEQAPTE